MSGYDKQNGRSHPGPAAFFPSVSPKNLVLLPQWPAADSQYLVEDTVTIVVQVMGKVRDQIEVAADASKEDILAQAVATEKIRQWTEGKTIVKQIYVPGKLVNLVVK